MEPYANVLISVAVFGGIFLLLKVLKKGSSTLEYIRCGQIQKNNSIGSSNILHFGYEILEFCSDLLY
jgi:hypothetical protein